MILKFVVFILIDIKISKNVRESLRVYLEVSIVKLVLQ